MSSTSHTSEITLGDLTSCKSSVVHPEALKQQVRKSTHGARQLWCYDHNQEEKSNRSARQLYKIKQATWLDEKCKAEVTSNNKHH